MAPSVKRSVYERSENHHYMVTIKNLNIKFTSLSDLNNVYRQVVNKTKAVEWSDYVAYELDSLNRLHIHTYCTSKYKLYQNRLKVPSYTVNLMAFPPKDIDRVISYIRKGGAKGPSLPQQLEVESYYYNLTDSGII